MGPCPGAPVRTAGRPEGAVASGPHPFHPTCWVVNARHTHGVRVEAGVVRSRTGASLSVSRTRVAASVLI